MQLVSISSFVLMHASQRWNQKQKHIHYIISSFCNCTDNHHLPHQYGKVERSVSTPDKLHFVIETIMIMINCTRRLVTLPCLITEIALCLCSTVSCIPTFQSLLKRYPWLTNVYLITIAPYININCCLFIRLLVPCHPLWKTVSSNPCHKLARF